MSPAPTKFTPTGAFEYKRGSMLCACAAGTAATSTHPVIAGIANAKTGKRAKRFHRNLESAPGAAWGCGLLCQALRTEHAQHSGCNQDDPVDFGYRPSQADGNDADQQHTEAGQ